MSGVLTGDYLKVLEALRDWVVDNRRKGVDPDDIFSGVFALSAALASRKGWTRAQYVEFADRVYEAVEVRRSTERNG